VGTYMATSVRRPRRLQPGDRVVLRIPCGARLRHPLLMDDVRVRRPRRALVITLWVLAALVVLPVGACTYTLFHVEWWEADVPAVVTEVNGSFSLSDHRQL
jgi:hypothetical protein